MRAFLTAFAVTVSALYADHLVGAGRLRRPDPTQSRTESPGTAPPSSGLGRCTA